MNQFLLYSAMTFKACNTGLKEKNTIHPDEKIILRAGRLDEIAEDGVSGYKVQVAVHDNRNEVDTGMMAQKIVFLLQNPGERVRFGNNGRNHYLKKYTADTMCEKMMNCYRELLQ